MNGKVVGRILFGIAFCAVTVYLAGGASFLSRPVGAIFSALIIVWMATIAAGRSIGVSSSYEKSQRWTYLTLSIIYLALFFASPWEYSHLAGPLPRDELFAWIGLAVFASGIAFRQWALTVMHGLYTARLGIQPGHHLVTSGPYRLVRHPGYLGELLSVLGIGLALSSIIGLAMAVLLLLVLDRRMDVEEKMLSEQFGQEYQEYAGRTKRLMPLIY